MKTIQAEYLYRNYIRQDIQHAQNEKKDMKREELLRKSAKYQLLQNVIENVNKARDQQKDQTEADISFVQNNRGQFNRNNTVDNPMQLLGGKMGYRIKGGYQHGKDSDFAGYIKQLLEEHEQNLDPLMSKLGSQIYIRSKESSQSNQHPIDLQRSEERRVGKEC